MDGKGFVCYNNGWDLLRRRFSGGGVRGGVAGVDTQLYGDQYSPRVRRAGATFLAVWTSLGQDGSREGVYGVYLNADGTVSGNEFRVNTKVVGSQMHQALGSDGAGRFIAAWTSLGGP